MEKEMYDVKVSVSEDGRIFIEQEAPGMDSPNSICLSSDQVDVLIDWLKEAKEKVGK